MSVNNNESGINKTYVNYNNLGLEVRNLIQESVKAMSNAYCPYSNFRVGASVLGATTGAMYSGCNVENASYGLSICAERTALVKAISSGDHDFRMMAVCGEGTNLATPCGACRQFIVEFATNRDIVIYLTNPKMDKIRQTSIYQLLPDYFTLDPAK